MEGLLPCECVVKLLNYLVSGGDLPEAFGIGCGFGHGFGPCNAGSGFSFADSGVVHVPVKKCGEDQGPRRPKEDRQKGSKAGQDRHERGEDQRLNRLQIA